jgi:uncharacterized protein (DUF1330 family)
MALDVHDQAAYQAYREGMMPILHSMGGDFAHDFEISNVLKSSVDHEVNRIFVIQFPNAATVERFFADEEYKRIRADRFDASVSAFTKIGEWEA